MAAPLKAFGKGQHVCSPGQIISHYSTCNAKLYFTFNHTANKRFKTRFSNQELHKLLCCYITIKDTTLCAKDIVYVPVVF